eukprot:Partr_v1_DN28476_c3_g1_i2_m42360 putative Coiled-coil domain containing 146
MEIEEASLDPWMKEQISRLDDLLNVQRVKEASLEAEESGLVRSLKSHEQSTKTFSKLASDLENAQKANMEYTESYRNLKSQISDLEKQKADITASLETTTSQDPDSTFAKSQMTSSIQAVSVEIAQSREMMQRINQDLEDTRRSVNVLNTAIKDQDREKTKIMKELAAVEELPSSLRAQCHVLSAKTESCINDLRAKQNALIDSDAKYEEIQLSMKEIEEVNGQLDREVERRKLNIGTIERQMEIISREIDLLKQRNAEQREERIKLEGGLKTGLTMLIAANDALNKCTREKDTLNKGNHRGEGLLSVAKSLTPSLKDSISQLEHSIHSIRQTITAQTDSKKEIKKTIDFELLAYLQAENLQDSQVNELQQALARSTLAQEKCYEYQRMMEQLRRNYTSMNIERQSKARDLAQLQHKREMFRDKFAAQSHMCHQLEKDLTELLQKSAHLESLLNTMKSDKTLQLSLIQNSRQVKLEITEKMRLLQTEVEIATGELEEKKAEAATRQTAIGEAITQKSTIQVTINRLFIAFRKQQQVIDQDDILIRSLQNRLVGVVEQLQITQKSFAHVSESRSKAAQSLLERNDETCLLFEKLNTLEREAREFEKINQEQAQDAREMRLLVADQQRTYAQLKRRVAFKADITNKWSSLSGLLQDNVARENEFHDLFSKLFDESNSKYIRMVPGQDRSVAEMKKLAEIAIRKLAQQDALIAKKDRLLEEMSTEIGSMEKAVVELQTNPSNGGMQLFAAKRASLKYESSISALRSEIEMYHGQSSNLKAEMENLDRQYHDLMSKIGDYERSNLKLSMESGSTAKEKKKTDDEKILRKLGLDPADLECIVDRITGVPKFLTTDKRWTTAAPRPVLVTDTMAGASFPVAKPSKIIGHHSNSDE